MSDDTWAHVRFDPHSPVPISHSLPTHLWGVSTLASSFAEPFGASRWGTFAGLWHDLGKYRRGFQRYIRQANGVDAHIETRVRDPDKTHSAAGALWAERVLQERFGPKGHLYARVLQYIIAGHHAGLANWEDGLRSRLAEAATQRELSEALAASPPADILTADPAALMDAAIPLDTADSPGRFALWLRMLFSALTDADLLDTEAFMSPEQARARAKAPTLERLKPLFDLHMSSLAAQAADTHVNRVRADVLAQCRRKAAGRPGVYTLTVPTGGGKTLASLAFALDHALANGQRRIVYAIPYTSIIEQTADVFRAVFADLGDDAVIEHHSNAESNPENENARSRLACENWDAPLVVTTNVQFFESLFARRTSRCRKLHNLVDSVIVLDEAQLLPVDLLQPVVDVLRLLVSDYGATVVLCTATQPVLAQSRSADPTRGLRRGIAPNGATEIIDDVDALGRALERVRVHLPRDLLVPRTWPDLADELVQHDAVLVIVNRRADARELFRLLRARNPAAGCWHLSALMCPQHRSDTLAEIKEALRRRRETIAAGRAAPAVRIVSTQLVECGVDLDLPVVYRALAGLDSIAQAAGRCNREGRLDGHGQVHVFVPPTASPPGLLRMARETCMRLWATQEGEFDPVARSLFGRYFGALYHDADLDKHRICDALQLRPNQADRSLPVRFRDAAEAFRMIDDDGATVLVRYRSPTTGADVDALIGLLERDGPSRWLMRKLQRNGVTIYQNQVGALLRSRDIREVPLCPGLYVQDSDPFYDRAVGANVDGGPGDPGGFVV